MENRLDLTFGKQPSPLRTVDLPNLAFLLTMQARKALPVSVAWRDIGGARQLVLSCRLGGIAILQSDWAKIAPFVQADSFSPQFFPKVFNYRVDEWAGAEINADPLYKHILGVLTSLFDQTYPTSDL